MTTIDPSRVTETEKQGLSDIENALSKLLGDVDKDRELPNIYIGAALAYKDVNNPDRFSMVAHSVREINNMLPRKCLTAAILVTSDETESEKIDKGIKATIVNSFDRLPALDDSEIDQVVEKWGSYYKGTHKQRLKQIVIAPKDEQTLPSIITSKIDETFSELIKLHKWFLGVAHHGNKSEIHLFDEKWNLIQDIWRRILSPFYGNTIKIDNLITIENPNKEEVDALLATLIKPKNIEYLFRTIDRPGWFDVLSDAGLLKYAQKPTADEEDGTIQSPPWWPGYYLLKIADKIPGKVTPLLQRLKINGNWNALYLCFQIVLALPLEWSKQLFFKIDDEWLDMKGAMTADKQVVDLFGKFVEAKDYVSAFQLLDILSKPIKKNDIGINLRIEMYWYKEDLMKKYLPALVQENPARVLEIIQKRLNEIIRISHKSKTEDLSYIWRQSIGEDRITHAYDYAQDIFVDILRDTLIAYYKQDPQKAETSIKAYLCNNYSIFKRIAIYVIDACIISEYYALILGDKKLFGSHGVKMEYLQLLNDKFRSLDIKTKKKILKLIQLGPVKENTPEYVKAWTLEWLSKIGEAVLQDNGLNKYHEFVKKYQVELNAHNKTKEKDDFESWVGPTSPLTVEDIKKMAPNEFIDYIKKDFKPVPGTYFQPTPEGLARLLGSVVKEDPGPYAAIAERFAEEGIYPAYPAGLLNALRDAWQNGQSFAWESVLKLCEIMLSRIDNEPKEIKEALQGKDAFDFGKTSWISGAAARLLGEAVRRDSHVIVDSFLPQIKTILSYIAEKDLDPETTEPRARTIEHNGEVYSEIDYTMEAINCNRGAALEALNLYALRYARIYADKEAEKDKGPFPPGHRLEPDVKAFLEKRMAEEKNPAVHSMFGRFFQYLYYLDQEWVEAMVNHGVLFSNDANNADFWDADWQGYILFNRFYDKLYVLLRDKYKKAIDKINVDSEKKGRKTQPNSNLADHIMIAYVRNLEGMENEGNLVKYFFANVPVEIRSQAIWFIGTQFVKEPPTKEMWGRLKVLWEYRVISVDDEELGAFVNWMKWAPEEITTLYPLIGKSIKGKGKIFHQHDYYDYLFNKVNAYPKESLKLTYELLAASHKYKRLYYGYQDGVKKILEAAKPHASEQKEIINKIVNLLGEIGDYSFKEYLIK